MTNRNEAFSRLAVTQDGPQKKFYLIKDYSDLLPDNRRELSCEELVAIIRAKIEG